MFLWFCNLTLKKSRYLYTLSVKKKPVMNLEPQMAIVHQLVELGAAGPCSNPFARVSFRKGGQKSFIPTHPHPTSHLILLLGVNTSVDFPWSSLRPLSLWLLVVMGGSIFIPPVQTEQSKTSPVLSHPISAHPPPSMCPLLPPRCVIQLLAGPRCP